MESIRFRGRRSGLGRIVFRPDLSSLVRSGEGGWARLRNAGRRVRIRGALQALKAMRRPSR